MYIILRTHTPQATGHGYWYRYKPTVLCTLLACPTSQGPTSSRIRLTLSRFFFLSILSSSFLSHHLSSLSFLCVSFCLFVRLCLLSLSTLTLAFLLHDLSSSSLLLLRLRFFLSLPLLQLTGSARSRALRSLFRLKNTSTSTFSTTDQSRSLDKKDKYRTGK